LDTERKYPNLINKVINSLRERPPHAVVEKELEKRDPMYDIQTQEVLRNQTPPIEEAKPPSEEPKPLVEGPKLPEVVLEPTVQSVTTGLQEVKPQPPVAVPPPTYTPPTYTPIGTPKISSFNHSLGSDQGVCHVARLTPWALSSVMYGGKV
jgi:hypothetical protein